MRKLILLFFIIPFFSCRTLNPNVMFQTSSDTAFAADSVRDKTSEYLIAPEDHLEMRIFTNDALKLADASSANTNPVSYQTSYYLVENNGEVKLPLLGRAYVRGMTVRQVETLLKENMRFILFHRL